MNGGNSIETRDLLVEYATSSGTVQALAHPGMSIAGGTSVAVMGPSGCGKSTLLGLLAGLAVPTSGSVAIGSTLVSQLPERERVRFRRRTLGMVYQADNLLPHLTVEENIALQLAISRRGGDGEASDIRPQHLLESLGMAALAGRFPDQLSGGQRQRAAVARAIVHRPAVVLADEPTGSLDDDSARSVIDLLLQAQREIGATLVVVTHDPDIAARTDRVEHLGSSSDTGRTDVG